MRNITLAACCGESFEVKYPRLVAELEACFAEWERLTGEISEL